MFPTALLLTVIAALTVIVAVQVAAAIRVKRLQAEADRKTGRAIGQLVSSLIKSGTAAIAKASNKGYVKALVDVSKVIAGDESLSNALLFGTTLSPTGRIMRTNNRPVSQNDPFSIENLIAALGDRPRYTRSYGVSGDRFSELARAAGLDRIRPEDVAHIKDAGSADPLSDPINPLADADPVELTAAHQVAGDGGVASEAEANAETQATPLPPDYAKTFDHGSRRPSRLVVERAGRPDNG